MNFEATALNGSYVVTIVPVTDEQGLVCKNIL